MSINETLEQFGLTKGEISVYVCLLQHGPLSPTDIAGKTGIKRPNVYDVVKNLEKNGLVHYQLINKRKLIVASDPDKIADLAKQKLNLAQSVIPLLKSINPEGSFQSNITFYQGRRSMQNLMLDALENKSKEIWYLWAPKDMDKILGKKSIEDFIIKRLKKGIKIRSLRPIEKDSFYSNEPNKDNNMTEIAYVPQGNIFSLSHAIYDDKVAFFSSKSESYGFLVESKEFAEVMRMYYQILWQNSGKLRQ